MIGSRYQKSFGLTLVEVVIAISVFAVILTLSYRIFSQLSTSKKILDERRDVGTVAHLLLSRLTRELQHVLTKPLMPPADNLEKPYGTEVYMLGKNISLSNNNPGAQLTFIAKDAGQFIRGQKAQTGIVQLSYRVEKDPEQEDKFLLIRDETPYKTPYKNAYEETLTFPICDIIKGLQLLFFDGRTNTWKEEWDDKERGLPLLIKFNLELSGANDQQYTYSSILPLSKRRVRESDPNDP